MLSDAARRERARRRELLTGDELAIIRQRSGDDPDVARLLEHVETLRERLTAEHEPDPHRRSLGPLTVVDEETHYFIEVTVKQKRAS